MTTIAAQQTQIAASFSAGMQSAGLVLAAGVMGRFFNPLGAGPLAFAMLPAMLAMRFGQMPSGSTNPNQLQQSGGFSATLTGEHTGKVDLGDGYKLEIDERNSEMTILNETTGQRTKIWGDPHVDVDGKHQFDFYGTTTFELDNGTKITINTEQWAGNPNAYVASQVVVTKGENAVVIDGISQNQLGDLSVNVSTNGYAIDAAHRDGFTVQEAAGGWQTETGATVNQQIADITKPGQLYGPGSEALSLGEASDLIGAFLWLGAFSLGYQAGLNGSANTPSNVYRQLLLA